MATAESAMMRQCVVWLPTRIPLQVTTALVRLMVRSLCSFRCVFPVMDMMPRGCKNLS
eukprot:TRINITY_DN3155_c0_g1_i1.p2 TRINITY_DN3155_c0_g1~~TRINITY_DN3155_c0_g1_i1.p2  ORF type:complete len:58 (-),score=7.12 TRINITY_DN3155_c0_g1_i1:9-182(-)